jgi:hypothetical protein
VLLTKIWAAILACLATAFLAGMFLLSFGTAGGFTEADRAALQATTEAGVAALAAEIQASPVSRAPAMLQDPTLRAALFPTPNKDGSLPPVDVPGTLSNVANTGLFQDYPQMTVALFDNAGAVIASHGAEIREDREVAKLPAYINVAPDRRGAVLRDPRRHPRGRQGLGGAAQRHSPRRDPPARPRRQVVLPPDPRHPQPRRADP